MQNALQALIVKKNLTEVKNDIRFRTKTGK